MCDRQHRYSIKAIGDIPGYTGANSDLAVYAVIRVAARNRAQACAVASHPDGGQVSYCPSESQRIETKAARIAGLVAAGKKG